MQLDNFLAKTKELLNPSIFKYHLKEKNQLETSLHNLISGLCNALEKKLLLDGKSFQTNLDESFEELNILTPKQAWTLLCQKIKALPKDIKENIHFIIQKQWVADKDNPDTHEYKNLWLTILSTEDSLNSYEYSKLDSFIDDLPDDSMYKNLSDESRADALLHTINQQPASRNYGLLFAIGGALCATTCVVSLSIAALAIASLIPLTSQAIALTCGVSIASGFFAYSLLRVVDPSNLTNDPETPSLSK